MRTTPKAKSISTFLNTLTFGVVGFDVSIPKGPTLTGTVFVLSNCAFAEEAGVEAKSTKIN